MFYRLLNPMRKSLPRPAEAEICVPSPGRGLTGSFDLDFSTIPGSVIWTSLAINVLGLALPLVALQIYDRILPNQATSTLAMLMLGLGIVIVLDTVMKISRSYLLGWEAAKLGCATNIDATQRFLGARRDEIDVERSTTWMDRFDALAQVNAANTIPARIVLIDILFIPVYLGLFAMIGGWLVLVPIAVIGPFLLIIIRRGEALRQCLATRAEQDRRKQDFLVESLNGIQAIKTMAMEPQIQRRYERLQRRSAEINFDVISLSQSLQSLGTLTSAISTVAVVSSGALIVIAGGILGALGGAVVGRGYRLVGGGERPSVRWAPEFLDRLTEQVVLRYLAVAHFGRGRGQYQDREYPKHWSASVETALVTQRDALERAWTRAQSEGADAGDRLRSDLRPILERTIRTVLREAYPHSALR